MYLCVFMSQAASVELVRIAISIEDYRGALQMLDLVDDDKPTCNKVIKSCVLAKLGDFKEAVQIADEILLGPSKKSSDFYSFGALVARMYSFWKMNYFDSIPPMIEQGLSMLEKMSNENNPLEKNWIDIWFKGHFYNTIGNYYWDKGNNMQALENYEKSYEVRMHGTFKGDIGASLNNLGIVHYRQGQLDDALNYYLQSLELKQELGTSLRISAELSNIGSIYLEQGALTNAQIFFERSIYEIKHVENSVNKELELAHRYLALGTVNSQRGLLEEAQNLFDKCLKIYRSMNSPYLVSKVLYQMGEVKFQKNEIDDAITTLENALDLQVEFGNDFEVASTLLLLIKVMISNNQKTASIKYLDQLKLVSSKGKHKIIQLQEKIAAALIQKDGKRLNDLLIAHEIFDQIISAPWIYESLRREMMLEYCDFLLLEYKLMENKNKFEEALQIINELYKYAQKEKIFPLIIKSLVYKARLFLQSGDILKAIKRLEVAEFFAFQNGLSFLESVVQRNKFNFITQLHDWQGYMKTQKIESEEQDIDSYLQELSNLDL